jgi:putative endopeptidase
MNTKITFSLLTISCLLVGNLLAGDPPVDKQKKAIDVAYMDLTVKPGNDFFSYANGGWLQKNPIPDQYTSYGAFTVLYEENRKNLQDLVVEASKTKAPKGSISQKIGDFYLSGMDTTTIEKLGTKPLQADFKRIESIKDLKGIVSMVGALQTKGVYPMFYLFSSADPKNSDMVIANLYQGGLGLPEVDYYLDQDPSMQEIRTEYVKHIAKMLELSGETPEESAKQAELVFTIEKRLAEKSLNMVDRRDPNRTYNKMPFSQLVSSTPNFDWQAYFAAIGMTPPSEINVRMPGFIQNLSQMLSEVPVNDWKLYLKWNIIDNSAPYLSSAFVKQNFDFNNAFLSGQKVMQPRWKRVLNATSGGLGEAIGKLYVEKFFPPQAKERMLQLVENLRISLGHRIKKLDWMSGTTKQLALEKLDAMRVKIGYPDKWVDYSGLDVSSSSYLQNIWSANNFEFKRDLAKIGKPVDKEEWGMTPQTVNAGYNPTQNEIMFPAGILQPPFFYLDADDAVNYGAIGVVIGHEMTHGFDDQGRKYDKNGNLADWWAPEDAEKFNSKTRVLVYQYDSYKMLDSLGVNGEMTLGENIADNGGLQISLHAFHKSCKESKSDMGQIDGFTPEQRFFLSYANIWKENIRDKSLARMLKEDVHSPAKARVNRALFNIDEFYRAFNIGENEKLFIPIAERAKVW